MRVFVTSSCRAGGQVFTEGQMHEVSKQVGRDILAAGRGHIAPEAPAPEAPAPEAPAPEAPAPTFAPVDMSEPRGGRRRRKD